MNMGKVRKKYIGGGDRKAPAEAGSGRVFIDDIRLTRP